jgi:hypothetical protein
MLQLADTNLAVRQNLATGRVSETITGRGLAVASASLSARIGAGPLRPLAARFLARPEGYFAFSILPGRDMPDFSAAPAVTLRAEFELAARPPAVSESTMAGAALALIETKRKVAGQDVTLRTVKTAPVDLSVAVEPAAVALRGIVLRKHDPGEPVAGVKVQAAAAQALTDAQGRFFLPALPVLAEVVLQLTENAIVTNLPFRVDYSQAVNSVTLSLPS